MEWATEKKNFEFIRIETIDMRYAIVAVYPFPIGMAPTNRIISYSKGIALSGGDVDVFIPFPTDKRPKGSAFGAFGNFQGIRYMYPSGRCFPKLKYVRYFAILSGYIKLRGYVKTSINMIKESKSSKISCVIVSTDSIRSLLVFSLLARGIRAIPVFIFDEYPIPIRRDLKGRVPYWKRICYKVVLRHFDAYISISQELGSFYNNLCTKPTFVLPLIVDCDRFNGDPASEENCGQEGKIVCYMGNMELEKDDIVGLIKSFGLIIEKYPDAFLHLYGDPKVKSKLIVEGIIESLNLKSRVILKGRIDSRKVPIILQKAHVLVSAQLDTMRAKGGFPTKLGEYLASGVPTLITDVGENAKYVKENKHLFLAKPGDPNDFADKLSYIFSHYDLALKVAATGRQYIRENYSHATMGAKLTAFLENLAN